jgi:fatty acid desaturase
MPNITIAKSFIPMENVLKAGDYLSREEINQLLKKNDWKAAFEIAHTWGWIAFAFFIVAAWTNPITIFIALWILGGKQLGCAIIMHDASHYSTFTNRKTNDIIGNWLGGYPILLDVKRYRPYHIHHHVRTGLDDDPDLYLTRGYPASRMSMFRKFLRDLTGLTGLKSYFVVLLMHLGYLKFTLGGSVEKDTTPRTFSERIAFAWNNLKGPIAAQLILFGIFFAIGKPWLYLLWIVALFTTNQFCLRVRSIAEHSVVPDRKNNFTNTRTTKANFIERLLFAPHHVNYHSEHHLLMHVPCYNYPKMHRLLLQKGFFEKGLMQPNYVSVLKLAAAEKS